MPRVVCHRTHFWWHATGCLPPETFLVACHGLSATGHVLQWHVTILLNDQFSTFHNVFNLYFYIKKKILVSLMGT